MNLSELYKMHFTEGGAYRRDAWVPETYWRLNSAPRYYNGYEWQGNRIFIPEQRYSAYNIMLNTEDIENDWSWVSQQFINNATIPQLNRATKGEDTIK